MANLVITSSGVVPSTKSFQRLIAGVAIVAGDLIYRDSTNKAQLSDANGVLPAAQAVDGIAVNSAAAGQPVDFVTGDAELAIGATVVEGDSYYLSATPGKMCPAADLAAGMRVIFVGSALAGNKLTFQIVPGGVKQA